MKQTTAPKSMVMVPALVVPGPGLVPELTRSRDCEVAEPGGSYGSINSMYESFRWFRLTA